MDIPKLLAGRFEVEGEIARRSSSVVYSGKDRELNRKIAIKIFVDRPRDNQEFLENFIKEVEKLKNASHHCLVPIISGGCEDGWLYIAMEHIDGPTLRDMLKNAGGPLEAEKAIDICIEIAEGLQEIHENNINHGHIDSRGILFKDGEVRIAGYYPKTVSRINKNTTSEGRLIIDPTYIAPEQIQDSEKVDGRADIYALSVLLFEMVTGTRPFSAKNPFQTAVARLQSLPPSPAKLNNKLSPLLDAAILKGLAQKPEDRFTNIKEFIETITVCRNSGVVRADGDDNEKIGTATIGVSMSSDAIKDILKAHESKQKEKSSVASGVALGQTVAKDRPIDLAATMAQVKTGDLLKASLIVLTGPDRGRKFFMSSDQLIIGSDPACDVKITGKDIASRYAILVKKGEEYHIGGLSSSPLVLNGEEKKESGDILLKRGDVIRVGGTELRYIAPGEVFSLRDEVVDRVIDRPEGKSRKLVMAVSVMLIVFGAGVTYFYVSSTKDSRSQHQAKEQVKSKKRAEVIAQLRIKGDAYFSEGKLIEPVGENAREEFNKILELSPDDTYAKRRLEEIAKRVVTLEEEGRRRQRVEQDVARLVEEGKKYFEAKQYVAPPGRNAREAFQKALGLDPKNEDVRKRLQEIDVIIADLVGQIDSLLAKAEVYKDLGQYVLPKEENAYSELMKVLSIDPTNIKAKELLVDMAARSIIAGDVSKMRANPKEMKRAYLTAQALGVDPLYIEPKLKGVELMERSSSAVIIYSGGSGDDASKKAKDKDGAADADKYLSTEEVERRIASINLEEGGSSTGKGRTFIDIGKKTKR